eukprot:TRINITY_DN44389_c0_g1_i1.p1 TRINITY_DN44389_c0_g1~~TRINITY_DN44389_c0_g1_i1.p1  ORF type:complete len:264 (-),score=34.49 TRINITY_DN44389_c0_g1_i1:47-769(-)
MDTKMAKEMATALIDQMGIQIHADKVAKKLSGGTKRKLSFAMAMVGGPRVVFLDEPSTGMDPATRRHMWEVIQGCMQGRCAILTTHSMEEADTLCGRIGIMVKGRLRCIGSSQELRQQYASSYLLEMKTLHNDKVPVIKRFVSKLFKRAKLEEEYAGRIKWTVPNSAKGEQWNYAATFQAIEDSREELGLQEYSFSQSTLEQVFINFAREQEVEEEADEQKTKKETEEDEYWEEDPPDRI